LNQNCDTFFIIIFTKQFVFLGKSEINIFYSKTKRKNLKKKEFVFGCFEMAFCEMALLLQQ
jgi:hypothetical protein